MILLFKYQDLFIKGLIKRSVVEDSGSRARDSNALTTVVPTATIFLPDFSGQRTRTARLPVLPVLQQSSEPQRRLESRISSRWPLGTVQHLWRPFGAERPGNSKAQQIERDDRSVARSRRKRRRSSPETTKARQRQRSEDVPAEPNDAPQSRPMTGKLRRTHTAWVV